MWDPTQQGRGERSTGSGLVGAKLRGLITSLDLLAAVLGFFYSPVHS